MDEESLPGFLFRTFGFMLPRDLRDGSDTVGAPIDLSDLSEKDTETALSTLEYPSLLFTGDQVVIYLGEVDGVYHAVTLPQTEEEVCEIEFADTSDFRSVNALR